MITSFKNRCVLNIYVIVLKPFFDTMYKREKRSKSTCELYITNCSHSYKVGIVFAMYQIMRSKGTYWAGPRHLPYFNVIYGYFPAFVHMVWQSTKVDICASILSSLQTCSSPRRPLFLHRLSFECTSKLYITFLNQFSVYFHI